MAHFISIYILSIFCPQSEFQSYYPESACVKQSIDWLYFYLWKLGDLRYTVGGHIKQNLRKMASIVNSIKAKQRAWGFWMLPPLSRPVVEMIYQSVVRLLRSSPACVCTAPSVLGLLLINLVHYLFRCAGLRGHQPLCADGGGGTNVGCSDTPDCCCCCWHVYVFINTSASAPPTYNLCFS